MIDPNLDLATAQSVMTGLVDNYRSVLGQTYFTYQNSQWDSDPVSAQNIMSACIIALLGGNNLPPGFMWRDYNNNMHEVTGVFMYGMMGAGATFVTMTYQASWQHKANILALTDPIAVQEYDYASSLWPDPNTDYSVT